PPTWRKLSRERLRTWPFEFFRAEDRQRPTVIERYSMRPLFKLFRFLGGVCGTSSSTRQGAKSAQPRRQLRLEALEDRLAPSASPVSLGAAAGFGVLGLPSALIGASNTAVNGDVGISQGG